MSDEMIDVVDENDMFVRKTTRSEVKEKLLLHRLARVIVLNKEGKLLVQKRSKNKEFWPGYWDIGLTETLKSGEGYETAAMRGLMEELGIIGVSNIQLKHSFLFKLRYTSQSSNVLCKVYKHTYSGKIKLNPEEIEEVKFLTAAEIEQFMVKEQFTPGGTVTFNAYLQHEAQKNDKNNRTSRGSSA